MSPGNMTASQRVLFTALPLKPDPDVAGRYHLSVHVSPRLTTDTKEDTELSAYPDWANWPGTVGSIGWTVVFGDGSSMPATVVSPAPRTDLWQALFADNTLIRSLEKKSFEAHKVRSYPARNIREFIRARYTDVAINSPNEFPDIDAILADFHDVDPNVIKSSVGGGISTVESQLTLNKAMVNGPALQNPSQDFYQLVRFHQPRVKSAARLNLPVPKPVLDFHEAVSTIGQHPTLMRLLGLAVDLAFDVARVLPASPNDVRVVPTWSPSQGNPTTVVSVRTHCVIAADRFQARPRPAAPAELVDGRMPLNDPARFTVIQEDLDGAATKVVDFTGNLQRLKDNGKGSGSPDTFALPSLRSGGLQVARINRAPQFHDRMTEATIGSQLADNGGDVFVYAEDVTRGYRIDVRDVRDATWFSLTARSGEYKFLKTGQNEAFADEAWVTATPTEDEAEDLYLQETLFRWGGWSLAAPRPGGRLATTQAEDPPVTTEPNTAGANFPVEITVRATPGTLPRLRFGRRYQVRARAVDLVGNSVPLDPQNRDPHASPEVDYTRYEPVQTPPVLPVAPRTEGESLERVVMRSNYKTDPDPAIDIARHIVPPKAAQVLAEHHGLFDTAFPASAGDPASKVNAAAYDTITKYPGPKPPAGPVLPSEQGDFAFSNEAATDPADHKKTRYFPVSHVTLPYLPDPFARGALLRFLDGPHAGFQLKVPFAAASVWPDYRPVRLVVRGRPTFAPPLHPSYDAAHHEVEVPLRKGETARVRLSAYLNDADVDQLGIWQWMVEGGGAGLREEVREGRHWMVTPFRTLTIVHTVRQPLAIARFANLGQGADLQVHKNFGETVATFGGSLNYSRRSTSRVDVIATWGEFVDRGPGTANPTPVTAPEPRRAIAFSIDGDRAPAQPQFDDRIPLKPAIDRQEFGDTKHRRVSYTTVATTRFAEYFQQRKITTVPFSAQPFNVALDTGGKGVVAGSVGVKNQVDTSDEHGKVTGAGTYVEGKHFTVNAAQGVVTIKKVGDGVPPGQQIVITYLVPPLVRPGPDEPPMARVTRSIPSSARPAAPKVLYVVPTFGWSTHRFPQVHTVRSKRLGRGLRVYLERPWWSSGEGELLGVIAAPGAINDTLAPSVTRWGVDPAFRSSELDQPNPGLFDFPAAVAVMGGLTAPGVAGTLGAFGHKVGFDTARKLWYSDIVVDTRSYFPFIRLALARFQPDSVADAHLSQIVQTDFAQLAPDRTASTSPAGPNRVNVTVTGQSYSRAGASNTPARVRVSLELFDASVGGELGWEATNTAVDLTPQTPVGGDNVWHGVVQLRPNRKQRLVIEEFERHRTGAVPVFGERIVYTDTIEFG